MAISAKVRRCRSAPHRGDGCRLRASCLQPCYQSRENFRLLARILVREVLGKIAYLGVRNGQLQTRTGLRVTIGQASVVEFGRGRPYSANQPDVHCGSLSFRVDGLL